LRGALVTAERYQVGTVLCVQDKEMQQAWCLATTRHRRVREGFDEKLWATGEEMTSSPLEHPTEIAPCRSHSRMT
jgi:hypothetical protein